ncbi:pectinesterase inhibitor 4-like [Prosopis cineraria]|uniref:pectinesterase inhibitor 4-like n=1 Tax=Prosopis cineraria TaxID=364024 RepID=UPI0024101F1F|nr:pectinesterase inhibitor 4-like [Prosopis cineraria]
MEGNTFIKRLTSYTFLSFHLLILFTLLSLASACNNNSTFNPPSYYSNQTSDYNYSQNNTNPSSSSNQIVSTHKNTMNTYKSFVFTSCKSSTYPSICYQYLSQYASKIKADPFMLCNSSLSLVLKQAKKTSSLISKLMRKKNISETSATAVLNDCLDNVRSSIDEIKESLDGMNHLDGTDKEFQMSTIKTYVSAAITDHETCSDGLDEENVDASVREKVRESLLNVQRMTSNALYFINNLNY